MDKLILYHGTTIGAANQIVLKGFQPDLKHNWQVKSKPGMVYLSSAYAPFYAENAKSKSPMRAIVKVQVDLTDLYPEDDFLMAALGKPKYTQVELDQINLEDYKQYANKSLEYMGNAAVKPEAAHVIGMRKFNASKLMFVCDPVISSMNYRIMGEYYQKLTAWIYDGNDPLAFVDEKRAMVNKMLAEVKI